MSTAELLEQALKLSREEQLQLAHDLWVGGDGPYDSPADVEAAWASELNDRLDAILDGSDPGLSDADVRRRVGL